MISFAQLDDALDERSKEWDSDLTKGLLFRSNELGGEVGEAQEVILQLVGLGLGLGATGGNAQNVAKKLVRESEGIVGTTATVSDLANELADVVICAARIAKATQINLGGAVMRKFNDTSRKYDLKARIGYAV
jgi:NTP pyrophosphatase (non-canonical NTP hydrolase)